MVLVVGPAARVAIVRVAARVVILFLGLVAVLILIVVVRVLVLVLVTLVVITGLGVMLGGRRMMRRRLRRDLGLILIVRLALIVGVFGCRLVLGRAVLLVRVALLVLVSRLRFRTLEDPKRRLGVTLVVELQGRSQCGRGSQHEQSTTGKKRRMSP